MIITRQVYFWDIDTRKISTFSHSIAIYKCGVTDMKDKRTGMSTNIHKQHVSKIYWSYCCSIHPSIHPLLIVAKKKEKTT